MVRAREIEPEMTNEQYKDRLREIYGDEVNVCGLKYDSANTLEEIDPIAFRCGKNDIESEEPVKWRCDECDSEYETEEEAEECCKEEESDDQESV